MKLISILFSSIILIGFACLAVVQIVKTIDFFKSRGKSNQKVSNLKEGDDN